MATRNQPEQTEQTESPEAEQRATEADAWSNDNGDPPWAKEIRETVYGAAEPPADDES
jgi:hypothetical protein